MNFRIIFFALFFPLATLASDLADFKLPLPEIEKLPNGLTVAWFRDDKLPVIDLALLIESGTRNDPKGKSGTVEMLARLLERGSNGLSASDLAYRVESLGASGFAAADEEGITIGMHGLSQDSETLLEMISWIARRPNFSPVEYNRERDRLDESWKHLGDSAESLAGYVFAKAILNGTPYERGSLESRQSLARISVQDVQKFHRAHFTPANALLMVVGRVDKASYRKKILEYFGDWKGTAPKKTEVIVRNPKFATKKGEILIVDSPGLPQAQVRMGFPIPGIHSPKRHALAVANAFLGEYFNSRLNLIVRDRLGLAYGIHSSLTYLKKGAFLSIASATAAPNSGKLLEEVVRQLRLLKAADVLAGEVEVAKDYLIGGYPLAVSTLGAVASRWLAGYSFNLGPGYMNEYVSKISVVGREALVQSVDEAFQLNKLITVFAGDAKTIQKSLREKGFKRFRVIPAMSLL